MKEREMDGLLDLESRLQIYGVLSKRPSTQSASAKWAKRFFIVRDGFMLYYPDSERKDFEKRKFFNLHPKAAIPLGCCDIQPHSDQGHPFSIHISSEEFNVTVVVAAESEYERDKWVSILRQSARITWQNVHYGETVIQRLEEHGIQLAQERKDYFAKLQEEATALHDEKQKTEELEKVKEVLETEKHEMEQLAAELREDYARMKQDLDDTAEAMKTIEEDKATLRETVEELHMSLEELENEREKTLSSLQASTSEKLNLSQEKESLSAEMQKLQGNLAKIEERSQKLLQDKAEAELRLKEKQDEASYLAEEKIALSEEAQDLQDTIKDLTEQKTNTENELKNEVLARLEAERRLREAEASLARLETAVVNQGSEQRVSEEVQEEMLGDVKTLKRYFENLSFEAKIDADKTSMVKNAMKARKNFVRRAKTLRFETTARKRRMKDSPVSVSPLSPSPDFTTQSLDNLTDAGSPTNNNKFRYSSVDILNTVYE